MPKFFFDVCDGLNSWRDEVGQEIDSLDSAYEEAGDVLTDLVRSPMMMVGEHKIVVLVRDEHGVEVYTATLSIKCARLE